MAMSQTQDSRLDFSSDKAFSVEITSWVCQEDLHTQLECLETTYFQDNSCLHSIPGAKVSASLRGHPLHLLRAELAGGCLGVGPSCCEGPEVRKTSQPACLRFSGTLWEAGGEPAVPIRQADPLHPLNPLKAN